MGKRKRKGPASKKKFTKKMRGKLVLVFGIIILAFVILMIRITYINTTDGEKYTKIVLDQQQYVNRRIPFKRGDIVDVNGTKLATSERVYNVILDAKILLSDDEKLKENKDLSDEMIASLTERSERYKTETKNAMQTYFQIDPAMIDTALEEKPDSRYIILKKNVDYATAQTYKTETKDNTDIQGIWLEEDYVRSYPYTTLACDVLGFCVDGNMGNTGLESYYNDQLNGTDGRDYGYQNEQSSIEHSVKDPVNGNTVVTTIDANVQSIVEKHLAEFNAAHKDMTTWGEGCKNGAVIMMNPNTGEIIAMATSPVYDLNNPRDLTPYYTQEQIDEMDSTTKLEVLNNMWRNFCVSDTFEPGSTIKPFTVATGLEIGTLTGDETYYCEGYLHVSDYDVKCIAYKNGGHGYQTVSQALENSCNVALMEMAMDIGVEEFSKYQHIFGFGEYSGIDLPGDVSAAPLLFTPENMKQIDLATNSFGQNFNVSMVQLISGFSSLINGGNYFEPHLVKAIQDENGNVIERMEPTLRNKTISKETSEQLKEYLYNVVQYGSGSQAQVAGYDIGGKTGTAEKQPRSENKNLLSFIGYAPQKNPEVVIYVVIDEPNAPNQALVGGEVNELAASIMEEAFPYLNVTKMEE